MNKKLLKQWMKNLKHRGVPMGHVKHKHETLKQYDAKHLEHMKRDLELK